MIGSFNTTPTGINAKFTELGCFPGGIAVIKLSENGSMKGPILATCVKHMDDFAHKFIQREVYYALLFDGHALRKDVT